MSLLHWAGEISRLAPAEANARAGWMGKRVASVLERGQGAEGFVPRFRAAADHASFTTLLRELEEGRLGGWVESRLGPRFLASPELPRELPRKIVVLGDVHNKWTPVQRILDHEFPEGDGVALAVGDLETYPLLAGGHQLFFISGNHEDFDRVRRLPSAREADGLPGFFRIDPGDAVPIGGLWLAGLGGIYSPRRYPQPKRSPRFFTSDEVARVAGIHRPIDLLLMHEAPSGVGFQVRGEDRGKDVLTDLVRELRPRVAFFGHHHSDFAGNDGTTRVVGLNYPNHSYVVLESNPADGQISLTRISERGISGAPTVLFGGGIPVEKGERVLEVLKRKHAKGVEERLHRDFLAELTGPDRESQATARVGLAVQTVLPHAARYIAAIEAHPDMPHGERADLMRTIHDSMAGTLDPSVVTDLLRTFQYFLQSWGLVVS